MWNMWNKLTSCAGEFTSAISVYILSRYLFVHFTSVHCTILFSFFLLCFCTILSIHNVCVYFCLVVFKLSYQHQAGVVLLISLYVLFCFFMTMTLRFWLKRDCRQATVSSVSVARGIQGEKKGLRMYGALFRLWIVTQNECCRSACAWTETYSEAGKTEFIWIFSDLWREEEVTGQSLLDY